MRKNVMFGFALALAVAMAGLSGSAFAVDHVKSPAHHAVHAKHMRPAQSMAVSVAGINTPFQFKANGKEMTRYELKVTEAWNSAGKPISSLVGKTIRYASAGQGKDLMSGHANESIKITGRYNRRTNTLSVNRFEKYEPKAASAPAPAPAAK